jgi:hypothetical protein
MTSETLTPFARGTDHDAVPPVDRLVRHADQPAGTTCRLDPVRRRQPVV